ncbi:DUF2252 domain-containing protein [Agromyces sp. NPDC127015]|uniref:DUF2252 domain-containing protein n=1 Tax=Agromyces sp. NPDC127015 TaxID=3347108 RepID=UPI003669F520
MSTTDPVGRLRYEHGTVAARDSYREAGREARQHAKRSRHARYEPPEHRDPLGIIERQNADRLQALVPLRMARMAESPFAFFRGTAALQAADLASSIDTGFFVVACGDAHISNFGVFAAPDRSLVFDLNDFDEASLAPWEWDLKRLATSVVIGARSNGFDDDTGREAAAHAVAAYRRSIHRMTDLSPVERFYLRDLGNPAGGRHASSRLAIRRVVKDASKRTSERVAAKIMDRDASGAPFIREQPPTLTHVPAEIEARLGGIVEDYLRTVPPDVAMLMSQYTATDVARRVVGVGSVGTRCFIVVFAGSHGDVVILQVKEAGRSVLDEFGGLRDREDRPPSARIDELTGGARVVTLQRILQSTSDLFLGHITVEGRGYYVRQFRDLNASFDLADLDRPAFFDYVEACATKLARAHSQSPRAGFIAGYTGRSKRFDEAIAEWSLAYAEQSRADYEAFCAAIEAGRFPVAER